MNIHKLTYNNDTYVMPYNPSDVAILSLGEPDGDYYQVLAKNKTDNKLYILIFTYKNNIDWHKPTTVRLYSGEE